MKPKVVYLLLFTLFSCPLLKAQKVPLPTDIGAKVMIGNYGYANGVDTLRFTNGIEAFFSKYVTPRLSVGIPLRLGVSHLPEIQNNINTIGVDGLIQFHLTDYDAKFSPYLHAGGGIVLENFDSSNVQIPAGIGFNIRLAPNSFLTLHTEYRYGLTQELRNNIQVGIGYTYRLGRTQTDTDGDGVPDLEDQCPDEIGTKELAGCPDKDGDGITDIADACPNLPGTEATLGCPDADGDGIVDSEDDCPDDPGFNATRGCPDADGDGIADALDDCPNQGGTVDEKGCPLDIVAKAGDLDNDGIPDADDDCPNEKGQYSAHGCPDSDGDGIANAVDACPEESGSPLNNGCPEKDTKVEEEEKNREKDKNKEEDEMERDSDGDGVLDAEDDCPNESGSTFTRGCPDSDNDGIADRVDNCPNEAGTPSANGCPEVATPVVEKDTDGDGVLDTEDYCPDQFGEADNNGCPLKSTSNFDETIDEEVPSSPTTIEEQQFLSDIAQNLQFEVASPVLKAPSYALLDRVASIMMRYPEAELLIEGHTDDVGRTAANQLLSEQRATACREYLLTRNIDPDRIKARGHGELRPIASNATREGRRQNRRVEFKLYQ